MRPLASFEVEKTREFFLSHVECTLRNLPPRLVGRSDSSGHWTAFFSRFSRIRPALIFSAETPTNGMNVVLIIKVVLAFCFCSALIYGWISAGCRMRAPIGILKAVFQMWNIVFSGIDVIMVGTIALVVLCIRCYR